MTIAEAIKELRGEMTRKEMAELLDLNEGSLYRWESGKFVPSFDARAILAGHATEMGRDDLKEIIMPYADLVWKHEISSRKVHHNGVNGGLRAFPSTTGAQRQAQYRMGIQRRSGRDGTQFRDSRALVDQHHRIWFSI